MIENHYGYGLRNDEKPYAHKIPPGNNWRVLTEEEQRAFLKGSYGNGGGNSYCLRRMSWDEPAATIVTAPMGKTTCQLHPGEKPWEVGELMADNHEHLPFPEWEAEFIKHIPPGGNWKDVPDNHLPERFKRLKENDKPPSNYVRHAWDKPSGTIRATLNPSFGAAIHPGWGNRPGGNEMFYNVIPQRPSNGLSIVELFAGGGLMASGLKAAGYNIVWANDFDKFACIAYRHNHGDHIVQGDITAIDIDSIPDADIIAGGPPCQDFSVAGAGAGEEGDRGKLVWNYMAIIEKKQPKAFIFENVKGLVGKQHKHTFDALLQRFGEIGFNLSHRVVMAWDHGVAQKRERVFIVGIRQDLNLSFVFPDPLPEDYRTQLLRDAIGDLPEPMQNVGKAFIHPDSFPENHENIANELIKRREDSTFNGNNPDYIVQEWNEPCNTVTESARKGDSIAHPGGVANHNPEKQLPRGYQNVIDGITRSNYGNGIKINDGSEPASTILARYWEKGPPNEVYQPTNHEGYAATPKEYPGHEFSSLDEPAKTIVAGTNGLPGGANSFYPENQPHNHDGHLFDNVNLDWTYEKANRPASWEKPSATIGGHVRNEGIHPGPVENHDRWLGLATDAEYLPQLPASISGREAAKQLGPIYWQNYGKAGSDEPGLTIVADGKPRPHPNKPRRFTVRECLRIQSVPDWYIFPDSISLSAQYRIVGNGVASRVAYLLGIALAEQLQYAVKGRRVEGYQRPPREGQIDMFGGRII